MPYSNLFLYFIVIANNHYEICCKSPSTKATTCAGSETIVASQTGLHSSHHWTYSAGNTNTFIASLCGPTSFGSLAQTSCPRTTRNDGVMEMQKVLEDPQRKACALPTLWRTLGQSPGSYLPSTGERLLPAVEQGKITTCEREGAIQQLGLGNAHIPWQKWIQQTTDTGTTSTQEEQGSTLCSHDASPSVEAGSCSIQGERNILFGNGISTSRVCKGNQRGLSRWQRHAGERQKGCGEARPTEWKTAVFSHEQGHQASGQNQKRDEKPAGCAKQAQVSLDETYEITDRDLDQAGRGIRYPTKGLLQQDPHCTPKYPDCSQRLAEAHSRGCSRSHDRSTGVCNRGGRAHGGGCGCGGRFSAISSARATCEVPENSRSIHSGRNCQRRGKCHGHKCRTSVKTPTFYRAIWLWWQVTLGIDGACLRKDHREPPSQLQEDAGMRAEAYDWYRISCAACSNDSYQPLPLHSKTFNDDECDFPFMALHRAFTLSMQCDTWNHNFNDDIPLTSCTWTLPILKPFRHRVTSKRAVNFSSFVDYFHFPEEDDEYLEQHTRRPRSRSPRRPPRTPPADRGDVTSLLAHQPRVLPLDRQIIQNPDIAQDPEAFANDDDALSEDETSSSTASIYSSTEPTSFAHLFMLRMPMTAARIRIGTSPLMHSSIRYALQLGRHEIQQIHVMEYRPPDLYAANTITALVQRSSDLQPGDNRRIVLVDIVFHEHAAVDISTHRYATTMRKYMTRRVLLEELKIHPYCKAARQQCIVRVNGKLISLSMYAPFDIHHGDYVRVDLPPHHRSQLSTKSLLVTLEMG